MSHNNQARRINTLATTAMVLSAVIVAILLLVLANNVFTGWLSTVTEQVGGTVLVAALLSVAWDLVGRRALAGEVMEVAGLSGDVQQAGLTSIGSDFRKAPWDRLLQAEKIDIYLGLGRTFYTTYSTALTNAAAKADTRIRVVLPDPTDDAAVDCMAERFTRSADDVRGDIRATTEKFHALGRGGAGTVEVYHRTGEPLSALYRFDNEAVVTLYSHRRGYGDVPYLLCRSGGSLYDFVRQEFDKLIQQGVHQTGQPPQPPSPPTPAPTP
ncbi:hypothetical protein SAMN05660748_2907 [Blastococcus aggregatus]|uniref:Uncharacterized protein n=1 Tax=Blastococcus aggregatus TaxID=38502 RepID=A0A285V890_9ACTN|nr:hypothetical protein [Blastococcus aggregatus]SOC50167.1 hypothetical protein SAMN05660748_2907 [Blastococcus aggregatus]